MGRRSRNNRHSRAELREIALRTAAEVVEQGGAAALTMREIARRIGYTVGALYMVFENLDDLVVQLNERTVIELRQALENVSRKERLAAQRLRLLAAAYFGFALLHTHRWRLVFEHRLPSGQKAPASYRRHTEAIFAGVQENLGQALGAPGGVASAELATALWSGVHGICILALNGKLQAAGPASVHRLLDVLLDRFLMVVPSSRRR